MYLEYKTYIVAHIQVHLGPTAHLPGVIIIIIIIIIIVVVVVVVVVVIIILIDMAIDTDVKGL